MEKGHRACHDDMASRIGKDLIAAFQKEANAKTN